jgi:dolichyl-phosphate-mannose--protein O-mannosyl transferase
VTISWSNPLVWLAVLPAMAHQIREAWKMRVAGDVAALTGRSAPVALFLISYLPLAVSTRPIWLLTSLAVLPFAFMILARSLADISGSYAAGKTVLAGYLVLVTIVSLLAWPMAAGKGMHYGYLAPFVERYRSVMEINRGG